MEKIKIYAFSDEASPDLEGQISALLRNQLDGMEIRTVDGENVSDLSLDKARETKRRLDDAGLLVWSIGSPIGKIELKDDFESHLDKFKHTLELADILGCHHLRMFSFFLPTNENPDLFQQQVFDRLGRLVETAKGAPVLLCHENEKGIFGDLPERCLKIHQAFPEIRGVFDPANFVQSGVDPLAAWELLKDFVEYLHIKDVRLDGQMVPAGQGVGKLKEITAEFLKQGGRQVTIEPHLTVFGGFEKLERGDHTLASPFSFLDNDSAFDTACSHFKQLG